MKKKQIPGFPEPLSALCLGTSFLGLKGMDAAWQREDWQILDSYYDMGGRLFDTANVYGRMGVTGSNASEQMLGMWLQARKITDAVVLTKGCHYDLNTPQVSRVRRDALMQDLEESRRALGLDQIPLYFLHRDDETLDIREIVDACAEQVDAGRIRRFGLSNYAAPRVQAALTYLGADWDRYLAGVSNEWSMPLSGAPYVSINGKQTVDAELLSLAKREQLPLFPYSATGKGFFAKLRQAGVVHEAGQWQHIETFAGNRQWLTAENGEQYRRVCSLSDTTGLSATVLSAAWLTVQGAPVIPVMGAKRLDHMKDWEKFPEAERAMADETWIGASD